MSESRRTGRRARIASAPAAGRDPARFRTIESPFEPLRILSDEQVELIHDASLRLLEGMGIRVLLPEAAGIYQGAGALFDEETRIVRIGRELVDAALTSAPATIEMRARNPERSVRIGGRRIVTVPVSSPPNVSDLDHGKRPSSHADALDFLKLTQHFDVMHMLGPCAEPQDVALALRHLVITHAMLTVSDKVPFVFSRGRGQVRDGLELVRIGNGVDEATFHSAPYVYTVINTNSPRQLDIPMCMGIIDFARAGQLLIITPFTLAGAMAPLTLAGALTLQHAEALAGIVLAQLVRPGAPVVYGGFTSNVDMKSGAPAFGTPEYVRAALATGQLARRIGLPWRSSATNASNTADAQATYEMMMSLFGAVQGGANVILHAAGWLEGGLTASREKFVLDVEVLQMLAETFQPFAVDADELALDAIEAVGPGGHFFGGEHTLGRYRTAFYEPLVSDWSNFGQWTENGSLTATERANSIWKRVLAEFEPPPLDDAIAEELEEFVARRTAEGGAPPES